MSKHIVKFRIEPDGVVQSAVGRDAWCLEQLLRVGDRGFTSLENPAPRISHYIFKLRKAGLLIESIDEKHDGLYAGYHARYVLRSRVTVLTEAPALGAAA